MPLDLTIDELQLGFKIANSQSGDRVACPVSL